MSHQTEKRELCRICSIAISGINLNFGPLSASNRFNPKLTIEDTHKLCVGICKNCGLIQLEHPAPPSFIVPHVPWISYREPESHLDDLVERLKGLRSNWPQTVTGVGPFDGPLMARLEASGAKTTHVPHVREQRSHNGETRYPYLESIQEKLEPTTLAQASQSFGKADMVCCRYLLEHCHNPIDALRGLSQMITKDGLILIEVPDSSKFIARKDYSFIWEEHITYFTETTLRLMARQAGCQVIALFRYESVLEDALVAILKPQIIPLEPAPHTSQLQDEIEKQHFAFVDFAMSFQSIRQAYQANLSKIVAAGQHVAVLGAGHQALFFINALGLQNYISQLGDDDPNKQGMYPAGLAIPIEPSAGIAANEHIRLCLISVSPSVEVKVRDKLANVANRGGEIVSIFWNEAAGNARVGTA